MSNMQVDKFDKLQQIFTDKYNAGSKKAEEESTTSFGNLLSQTIDMTNQTDAIDQMGTEALVTGDVDDLGQVMVDMQKAELALQMTVQIRNKVVDAYNEIMRMQL